MKKTFFVIGTLLVVTAIVLAFVSDIAWSSDRVLGRRHEPTALRKVNGSPVSTLLNINNLAAWIRNDGWSARDPGTGNSGVAFPRGTEYCIFQDGIVWGGNVNDGGSQVLRVGGQTYSIGTDAGRIISRGVAARTTDADVRIYRIRRDFAIADLRQDAAELASKSANSVSQGEIDATRGQYRTDWNEWPVTQGAPFYDADSNGSYEPRFNADGTPKLRPLSGEAFDATKHADEPGAADADQVIWFVCNDLNAGRTNALYGSNPIGLELQMTLWGYNRTDPLANVYFKKFTFIYKGHATTPNNATITDMYVGQWSDPDEGDAGDDFAGCDTTLGMAYVYNGQPIDGNYARFGLKPPAAGYDFLQGPIVAGAAGDSAVFNLKRVYGKKNLPMTAAFYFAAGGTYSDPPFTRVGTVQWYNLLRGLTPISGTPFTFTSAGRTIPGDTKFWLDGDPVANNPNDRVDGFIDQPGDRRIGACSGPFTMALGDTQEIVVGVVAGLGSDYKNSITVMKNNDVAVQSAYNDLFDLPKAPPAPNVKTVDNLVSPALDKQIVLNWAHDDGAVHATEDFNRKGYTFQGYNIYQVASLGTSIDLANDKRNILSRTDVKLIATFDKAGDAVRTIADNIFDAKLGIIVPVVRQLGTDNGIQRTLVINTDLIRSAPLVNGQRYYFAVTCYGYNPSDQALTHALESTPRILTAIPQTPNPGVRYSAAPGDTVKNVTHTTVSGGKSDGNVEAYVVDPTALTGHSYKVIFDTLNGGPVWHVNDLSVTPVVRKISNQTNQTGDEVYSTVDGMLIKVLGAPRGLKDLRHVANASGPIDPPTYAAWGCDFNGWCFPDPSEGVSPSDDWGGGTWGIHTGGAGPGGDESYAGRFVPRVFRNDNFDRFVPYDFELRFTATGGKAWLAFTTEAVIDVPFELWNIGIGTPNDPSDDFRMIPWINDADGNGAFNIQRLDHALSGGDNDPYTDWIYWYEPNPKAPGTAGYDAFVAAGSGYNGSQGTGDEVMARVVMVNWNGGSVSNASWPANANSVMPATGNVVRVIATKPNRAFGDEFTITAPAAAAYDASTAKADVTKINVFPNPYYGFNRAETSKLTRFITFNHMPVKAEVRIFNLAGALVRGLVKDDPYQYFTWDLNNTNGLPVASGIYIAYITLKDGAGADLGTKTLKMVVIQEQQYLDNF